MYNLFLLKSIKMICVIAPYNAIASCKIINRIDNTKCSICHGNSFCFTLQLFVDELEIA